MTVEDFEKLCHEWISKFALHEYWWMIKEVDDTMTEGYAEAIIDCQTMSVCINIRSDVFEQEDAELLIKRIAFHEVCEVMLTALDSDMSDKIREQIRHSILNKIANALNLE